MSDDELKGPTSTMPVSVSPHTGRIDTKLDEVKHYRTGESVIDHVEVSRQAESVSQLFEGEFSPDERSFTNVRAALSAAKILKMRLTWIKAELKKIDNYSGGFLEHMRAAEELVNEIISTASKSKSSSEQTFPLNGYWNDTTPEEYE